MTTSHILKTLTGYFDAVHSGEKTFEIRQNDRGFAVGDTLHLLEWDGDAYTGREAIASVRYMTDYMQRPGYVVMAIVVTERVGQP